MANSVDPDGTAHYEPSHLDLHCLHKYQCWFVVLKGLKEIDILSRGITQFFSSLL